VEITLTSKGCESRIPNFVGNKIEACLVKIVELNFVGNKIKGLWPVGTRDGLVDLNWLRK
jgi:hypothetical protein